MKFIIQFLKLFFDSFKFAIRDIMLFPGTNLKKVFYISFCLSTISLFCWVFQIPQFLDWRGGFLGTLILGILIVFSIKEE